MKTRTFAALVTVFLLTCATMTAWVRSSPAPVRINATDVNIERVVDKFRIVNLGEHSVYVPSDQGGTGQRVIVEMWALQAQVSSTTWVDMIRAWGMTDDVVPFLQSKQREYETNIDSMMFGQPGYTAKHPFEPF